MRGVMVLCYGEEEKAFCWCILNLHFITAYTHTVLGRKMGSEILSSVLGRLISVVINLLL